MKAPTPFSPPPGPAQRLFEEHTGESKFLAAPLPAVAGERHRRNGATKTSFIRAIPQPSVDALRGVGRWMKVNGEAIYGAKATVFGNEFGKYSEMEKDGRGKPKYIVNGNWRCTTKPGKVSIHIYNWQSRLELPPVKGKILGAHLLADKSAKVEVRQTATSVHLTLPEKPSGEFAAVLCLEVQ